MGGTTDAPAGSGSQSRQPPGGIGNTDPRPEFLLPQITDQLNGLDPGEATGEIGQGPVRGVIGEFTFDEVGEPVVVPEGEVVVTVLPASAASARVGRKKPTVSATARARTIAYGETGHSPRRRP